MKKITQLLSALVFLSLSIFISCGGGDDPVKIDPQDVQGELLTGVFTESGVTADGDPREEWDGFSLTLGYNAETNAGTFTATGVPSNPGASDVWPASGTWTFVGEGVGSILRSDGITIDIPTVSATGATLSFTIDEAGGRTFDGLWRFTFNK